MDRLKYFPHLVHDISELHHTDSDQSVVPAEAVVLHSDVELVGCHLLLVADNAGGEKRFSEQSFTVIVGLWGLTSEKFR